MKELFKWGLLAAAAYFLLRPTIAGDQEQPAEAAPPAQPAAEPPPLTTQPVITEEMISKAAADPALAATVPGVLLNADQWNWYAERLTGQPGPDVLLFLPPNTSRDTKITAVQYWQWRKEKGLAGLGRLAALLRR